MIYWLKQNMSSYFQSVVLAKFAPGIESATINLDNGDFYPKLRNIFSCSWKASRYHDANKKPR